MLLKLARPSLLAFPGLPVTSALSLWHLPKSLCKAGRGWAAVFSPPAVPDRLPPSGQRCSQASCGLLNPILQPSHAGLALLSPTHRGRELGWQMGHPCVPSPGCLETITATWCALGCYAWILALGHSSASGALEGLWDTSMLSLSPSRSGWLPCLQVRPLWPGG